MGGDKTLVVTEPPDTSDDPLGSTSPTVLTTVSSKFTVEPWREAWVGYQQFTFARAKYGLFKIPFSVDENTGATNLDFAYRSLAASTLAPCRDEGWTAHGQVVNHAFGFEYGVFDHDGHNAHTGTKDPLRVTGGQTTAWRMTSEPLRNVTPSGPTWRSGTRKRTARSLKASRASRARPSPGSSSTSRSTSSTAHAVAASSRCGFDLVPSP